MTPQIPLGSGFGPRTTARDVLGDRRLDRLHVVINGGSAGVGLETTRACAGAGAHVRVGARSLVKAQAVLAGVADVEIDSLDLADPASIDAFAARTLSAGERGTAMIPALFRSRPLIPSCRLHAGRLREATWRDAAWPI